MSIIMLYTQGDIWVTESSDPYRKELFGSSVLPTVFSTGTSAEEVYREIRQLNPSATVMITKSPPKGETWMDV